MKVHIPKVRIEVSSSVFIKDPESSDLGRRIVTSSIHLIDEMGFDHFTFKKLAEAISSTEASVYRYFENKHKLLLYLHCWYWRWLDYQIAFSITNIDSPVEQLSKAVDILTREVEEDSNYLHINETALNRIVIAESTKTYLTKQVDEVNKEGAFLPYKQLVERISSIILEINPTYKYPHMLLSTVIEGAHLQRFFAKHLPRLTDVIQGEDSISRFYNNMVIQAVRS